MLFEKEIVSTQSWVPEDFRAYFEIHEPCGLHAE